MDNSILKVINTELENLEKKENIKILHCVESGSRAWGFASSDSDYDVRFIYVRPKDFYLRLDKTRDVIEWKLDETLDINGWDIQKALTLLQKSNPTLFEWNNSPIVYKTTEEWKKVSNIINNYFVQTSGLKHYLSMAKSNKREFLSGETVKFKKYFYVLRPLLACKWILKNGTPPPMEFEVLVDGFLENEIKPEVLKLLEIKRNSPEITHGERIDKINSYIDKTIDEIEKTLQVKEEKSHKQWEELNELFLSFLK